MRISLALGRIRSAESSVIGLLLLAGAGSVLPVIESRLGSATLLAASLVVIILGVRFMRPAFAIALESDRPVRFEMWMVAGIVMAAGALRLPGLGSNPPGLVVDEAFQALQGIAAWSGETIVEFKQYPYPTWPVWWAMTAAATRLFGATVEAARLPAAIIGVFTVVIAWRVARDFFGRAAGVAAALFVCGSFWHVHHSRLALEWNALVAEGLIVAWLLLAPRASSRVWASGLAGIVCGVACYGYTAAFYLPVWGLAVAGLKIVAPAAAPRRRAVFQAICFGAGLMAIIGLGFDTLRLRSGVRVESFFRWEAAIIGKNEFMAPANLLAAAPGSNGMWTNFPIESARLSIVERVAVIFGAVCLLMIPGLSRTMRWALGAWLPLALVPEMIPGEVHLARGLGSVAPLAILAGLAGRFVAGFNMRVLSLAALAAGVLNVGWTAKRLYVDFPGDDHVRSWYSFSAVEAADMLKDIGRVAPIEVFPEFTYMRSPILRMLLWEDIHEGRIIALNEAPPGIQLVRVFIHPLAREPVLVLLAPPRFPESRRAVLVPIDSLLEAGRAMERDGDLPAAAEFYRTMLTQFPKSTFTRERLVRVIRSMRLSGIAGE